MRLWRAFKVFYQVITDREIYFLLGLAIRDLFRKTKSDPKPVVVVKKRGQSDGRRAISGLTRPSRKALPRDCCPKSK